MSASGVVAGEKGGEHHGASRGGPVGTSIGPFVLGGPNEAFGLSVGLGAVGPRVNVANPVVSQDAVEALRSVATAVVGHHTFDQHIAALVPGEGPLHEAGRGVPFLVRQDLGVGKPVASSTQTCRNSQPRPWPLPRRFPVMRCPMPWIRPSFFVSSVATRPGACARSADDRLRVEIAETAEPQWRVPRGRPTSTPPTYGLTSYIVDVRDGETRYLGDSLPEVLAVRDSLAVVVDRSGEKPLLQLRRIWTDVASMLPG